MAERLARKIEQTGTRVTGTRRYGPGAYALDCVDTVSGIPFVVNNPEDWEEREHEAQEYTMDRTQEVNDIRQLAADCYDNATCTLREYLALNPGETAADYAEALVEMVNPQGLDAHDMALLKRFVAELAQEDDD